MYGYVDMDEKEGRRQSENRTGIPDQLLQRAETKAGMSLRDVRVHYNSPKPSDVQALAYTQGSHIYIGPGQEEHLPHEIGHVVQQKEGQVRATTVVNGQAVNDDPRLERGADQFLK